ncbi:hypothetical protein GCM10010191_19090 [Actinomadura vinacea]|uniref:Uncharacterized protein n=1 Tax=Actinomadura vinacea TaxID=115336 RepID=A0ABN3IP96_9ACTN
MPGAAETRQAQRGDGEQHGQARPAGQEQDEADAAAHRSSPPSGSRVWCRRIAWIASITMSGTTMAALFGKGSGHEQD